jgi:hypothetical protein
MAFQIKYRLVGIPDTYTVRWAGGGLFGDQIGIDLLKKLEEVFQGTTEVGPIPGPQTAWDYFLNGLSARFFIEYLEEEAKLIKVLEWSGQIPKVPSRKRARH